AEEVVVDAVDLARARGARGGRDAELELGHALAQRADERALADPRGAGDDEDARHPRKCGWRRRRVADATRGPASAGHLARLRHPSAAEQRDELGPLALREPADGLARRDAALLQDLVGLHAAVLGHG